MKRNSKRILPYVFLGISLIALIMLFVGFMLRDTWKKTEIADASETVEVVSETVTTDENLDNAGEAVVKNAAAKASSEDSAAEAVDETIADNAQEDALEEEVQTEDAATEAMTENNSSAEAEAVAKAPEDNSGAEASDDMPVAQAPVEEAPAQETPQEPAAVEAPQAVAETPHTGGHLIVIDPGHQSKAMTDKEPNGPGSSNMKMKVTAGTAGKTTGLAESQLNLTIGLMLRDELQNRGYTVIMTRESQDVSLSNVDRAQIANNAGAEAFIRIHANGSDDTSVNGALTICQTASNPYNGGMYSQSRRLSDCVLDSYCASTGFKKQYVWETDTMTGINWANVPSTIIEMGYMSNPTDDTNMASADYQRLMTIGIANGIDNYFAQ